MFADDSYILVSGKSMEQIVNDVKYTLSEIFKWFQANALTLNINKPIMHFYTQDTYYRSEDNY